MDGSTKQIHEKTLRLASSLQVSQNNGSGDRSLGLIEPTNKTVAGRDRLSDMGSELPNGVNYYIFKLDPSETLSLELDSEYSGKIWMQFVKPLKADAMASAIRMANLPPIAVRSRKIKIKNVVNKPFEVILALYGIVGYEFTISIDRKI